MHCANLIKQLIDMCGYLSQSKNLAVRGIRKSVMRVSRHGHVSGRKNSQLGILIIIPEAQECQCRAVLREASALSPRHWDNSAPCSKAVWRAKQDIPIAPLAAQLYILSLYSEIKSP